MIKLESFKHRIAPGPREGLTYESYRLRIQIPFVYADGLWRLCVYGWNDERGWFASINGKKVRDEGYTSASIAATAICEKLEELGNSLAVTVKAANIVPVTQ